MGGDLDALGLAFSSPVLQRRLRSDRWNKLALIPSNTLECPASTEFVEHMALDTVVSQYLAVGSCRRVSIFSLTSAQEYREDQLSGQFPLISTEIPQGSQRPMTKLDWLPGDNGLLISSHRNGRINLWESESLGLVETINLKNELFCHAVSKVKGRSNVYLAGGHQNGIALVDLQAGAAVQNLPWPGLYPSTLIWDSMNEFKLLSGNSDGSLRKWDIRRPSRPLQELQLPSSRSGLILQMEWLGPDLLIVVDAAGFISLLSSHSGTLFWRSELEFHCLSGFAGTLISDTDVPMFVMPFVESVYSVNLNDGTELWSKPCLEFKSDNLAYNHVRSVPSLPFIPISRLT